MKSFVSTMVMSCAFAAALSVSMPAAAADNKAAPAPTVTPTRPIDTQRSTTVNVPAGFIITGPDNAECMDAYEGAVRYSAKHKTLLLCDGKEWKMLKTEPVAP